VGKQRRKEKKKRGGGGGERQRSPYAITEPLFPHRELFHGSGKEKKKKRRERDSAPWISSSLFSLSAGPDLRYPVRLNQRIRKEKKEGRRERDYNTI